jgi:small subunit ribosomal protein S17e
MDRIKRLSYEVLDQYKPRCSEDFTDNKKLLNEIAIIRSKTLKNKIAGYITKFIKKENREAEIKKSRADALNDENSPIEETPDIEKEPEKEPEENIIEVGADTTIVSETKESSEEKTE